MEVAALVLGIVSLVGGLFGVTGVVGPVASAVANDPSFSELTDILNSL